MGAHASVPATRKASLVTNDGLNLALKGRPLPNEDAEWLMQAPLPNTDAPYMVYECFHGRNGKLLYEIEGKFAPGHVTKHIRDADGTHVMDVISDRHNHMLHTHRGVIPSKNGEIGTGGGQELFRADMHHHSSGNDVELKFANAAGAERGRLTYHNKRYKFDDVVRWSPKGIESLVAGSLSRWMGDKGVNEAWMLKSKAGVDPLLILAMACVIEDLSRQAQDDCSCLTK